MEMFLNPLPMVSIFRCLFVLCEYVLMLVPFTMVAGQLGLKSSRPLSQLGPGSTRPESTRPGVFLDRIWYMFCFLYMYNHPD